MLVLVRKLIQAIQIGNACFDDCTATAIKMESLALAASVLFVQNRHANVFTTVWSRAHGRKLNEIG